MKLSQSRSCDFAGPGLLPDLHDIASRGLPNGRGDCLVFVAFRKRVVAGQPRYLPEVRFNLTSTLCLESSCSLSGGLFADPSLLGLRIELYAFFGYLVNDLPMSWENPLIRLHHIVCTLCSIETLLWSSQRTLS